MAFEGGWTKPLLLVNPYIRDFSAYNLWMRPFGLMGLYGFLKKQGLRVNFTDALFPSADEAAGYNLPWPESGRYHTGKFPEKRIDKPAPYENIPKHYRQFGVPEDALVKRLESLPEPGRVIMTSGMTYWYPGVKETVRIVKKVFPRAPVVLGGIYATLCAEHARSHSGADAVAPGRWQDAPRHITGREPGIKGRTEIPREGSSCETALYPGSKFGVVRLSEGCPFNCSYCASSLLSGGYRAYPVCGLFDEIVEKTGSGCEAIAFYDDALLFQAERGVIPLLERVARAGLKCRFHTPNGLHARYMDERTAELFRACNFRTVRLSFDIEGTRGAGAPHKVSAAQMEKAVRALCRAGYGAGDIEAYTLAGMSRQSEKDAVAAAGFLRALGVGVKLARYSPTPGTAMFREDCRLIPELAEEPLLHNSSIAPMWGFDPGRYDRIKETF